MDDMYSVNDPASWYGPVTGPRTKEPIVIEHTAAGPAPVLEEDGAKACADGVIGMEPKDYDRCVAECADDLFRSVMKQLRDRDEAKDVVQEAYLRLWMRLDRVRAQHARGYLFITAHNLVVDRSRKRKNLVRMESWHGLSQVTHQPDHGVREALDMALDTLTPMQRELVLLRDHQGHSYQEMALITGLDLTQVKVYLYRARKALQRFMGHPALVA